MLTTSCMLLSRRVRVRVRISIWLVSGNNHMHTYLYYFPLSLSLSHRHIAPRRQWKWPDLCPMCWVVDLLLLNSLLTTAHLRRCGHLYTLPNVLKLLLTGAFGEIHQCLYLYKPETHWLPAQTEVCFAYNFGPILKRRCRLQSEKWSVNKNN